jgi:penicillin-binding protein 2
MVRTRIKLLLWILIVPFVAAVARLAYLQLVPEVHARYWKLSQHRTRTFSAPIRGRIISRDGKVLAGNKPLYRLHANYTRLNPRREALAAVVREIRKRSPFPDPDEVESRILAASDPRALAASAEDGADGPGDLLPLVENVDRDLAERLEATLRAWPGFFELLPAGEGPSLGLWFRPGRLLAMEVTLHRVAALMGPPESAPATYALLRSMIDSEIARVEAMVERELVEDRKENAREDLIERKRKTIRALIYRRESWLLASSVPAEAVTAIEYHPRLFPGIEVEDAVQRVYPESEVCGTLTGYLRRVTQEDEERLRLEGRLVEGLDEGGGVEALEESRKGSLRRTDLLGTGGLEEYHDERLRGLYGLRIQRVNKLGEAVDLLEDLPPEDGEDVLVSIDAGLQRSLHDVLAASVRPLGGRDAGVAGSAAVMSLEEGELGALLASVGFPGIDPNRMTHESGPYQKELERDWEPQTGGWFLDRPSRHALYPGSVFKLVVAAAAMEAAAPWEGDYSPERRYECSYEFKLLPQVHCSARHPRADIDLVTALQHSCNSYFYYLGLEHLGPPLLRDWAVHFGYGRPTGVDLPAHKLESGILLPAEEVRGKRGACLLSIGHAYVRATPLQVLRGVAAIALGRPVLPRPWLVAPRGPHESLPIANARTAGAIREGLWRTAHAPDGTAADPRLGLHRFDAGFKTGTAEILSGPGTPHHAWLVGFAPFEAPRIAFVIVIEKTPLHGAVACAPVARRLLEHFAEREPGLYLVDDGTGTEEQKP